MSNTEAAKMFLELADLIDLAGELPFKSSAYRKVAASLINLDKPFEIIVAENRFDKIPGAGKAIKEKLKIMAETGNLPTLEKQRKHEIYDFYPLLSVYDVNPRQLGTLIRIFKASDISDFHDKLKEADLAKLTSKQKKAVKIILDKID